MDLTQNIHLEKSLNNNMYRINYERWKLDLHHKSEYMSWNLYKDDQCVASLSNDSALQNSVLVRHIESKESGMASKLIMMLLEAGVTIHTGIPNYNSCSTAAYYMNKKIVNLIIQSGGKFDFEVLGPCDNRGKEDMKCYEEVSGEHTKHDNYHYKFFKR